MTTNGLDWVRLRPGANNSTQASGVKYLGCLPYTSEGAGLGAELAGALIWDTRVNSVSGLTAPNAGPGMEPQGWT